MIRSSMLFKNIYLFYYIIKAILIEYPYYAILLIFYGPIYIIILFQRFSILSQYLLFNVPYLTIRDNLFSRYFPNYFYYFSKDISDIFENLHKLKYLFNKIYIEIGYNGSNNTLLSNINKSLSNIVYFSSSENNILISKNKSEYTIVGKNPFFHKYNELMEKAVKLGDLYVKIEEQYNQMSKRCDRLIKLRLNYGHGRNGSRELLAQTRKVLDINITTIKSLEILKKDRLDNSDLAHKERLHALSLLEKELAQNNNYNNK